MTPFFSFSVKAAFGLTFGLSGEGHVVVDGLAPSHGHDGDGVVVEAFIPVDVGRNDTGGGELVAVLGVKLGRIET